MIPQAARQAPTIETSTDAAAYCWSAADELSAAGETILFVEDEAFVRGVTGEVLRSAGYRVLVAKDAATAARTYDAERGDVDLLLTDVVLPARAGARWRRDSGGRVRSLGFC